MMRYSTMKRFVEKLRRPKHRTIRRQPRRASFQPKMEYLEMRLAPANVTTWHNDNFLSGLNNTETTLTTSNVNANNFGKLFSYQTDGYVYAQPLYVSNLTIGGGSHNVAFVATEGDSVYAFDTDSPSAGPNGNGVYWQTNLIIPRTGFTVTTVPSADTGSGDIVPQIGITGTPLIDTAHNTLYVLAKTKEVETATSTSHYVQRLYALSLSDGSILRQVTVGDTINTGDTLIAENTTSIVVTSANTGRPGDTSPPTGPGVQNGEFRFNARRESQRGAIVLAPADPRHPNGLIYLDFASHGDNGNYRGWVIAYDPSNLTLQQQFLLALDARAVGIWQSGAPVAIQHRSDGYNDLFFSTGNGFGVNTTTAPVGPRNLTESVVKIGTDPATGQLRYEDSFTPYNWASLDAGDTDLGSGGAMILPDGLGPTGHPNLIVETGKQGRIYLLDRNMLGGLHPDQATEKAAIVEEVDTGITGVWGSPAYFNGRIYYHGSGDSLKSLPLVNGLIPLNAQGQVIGLQSSGIGYGFPGAQPSISANGTSNGVVWELETDNYNDTSAHEVLRAFNANNLGSGSGQLLYASNQSGGRDQLSNSVKFVVPTVADGKVLVGSGGSQSLPYTGQFSVFGLFPTDTMVPAAPQNLSATASSSSSISLTWDRVALTGGGEARQIDVERSADGGATYTPVAVVSRDATSYVDTGLASATHYFYRIRAENTLGPGPYSDPADAITTLGAPTLMLWSVLSTQVDLSWTPVSAADAGYVIQRSDDNGQTFNTLNTVGAGVINYSDTGLSPQQYQYRVIAQSQSGQSSVPSNVVVVALGIDYSNGFGDGGGLTFNGAAHIVSPGWLQLTDGGFSEAATAFANIQQGIDTFHTSFTYRMHDGTDPRADGMTFIIQNNSPSAIGPGGGGLAYGADNPAGGGGIPNSVAIKFDLYNNVSEGTNSTGIFSAGRSPTIRNPNLPPTPTPLIPDTSVNLSASPYTNPDGTPIININDQHLKQVDLDYDGTTLTETITDLQADPLPDGSQPHVTIHYTVNIPGIVGSDFAYVGFGGGTGGLSVVQEVRTWDFEGTATHPATPLSLYADPYTYSNLGEVKLSWREISNNVTGFQLERSQADANGNLGPWTVLGDLPFNQTTYFDMPGAGTYYYRVQALADAGASGYANSGPVAVLVPEAPTYLFGRPVGPTTVHLQWTNNSFTQTGFRIERSVGDQSNFQPIGTTDALTTTFDDTTVSAPNTYFYRVYATNDSGDSVPSNVARVPLTVAINPVLYYRFDEPSTRTTVDFGNGFAINGTANHPNLTTNGSPVNFFPGTPGVMRLTDGQNGEATSVWYNTPVSVGAFSTTFTLQDHPNNGAADSLNFVIQNDPAGTGALGGGGGGGGYAGIQHSVAVKFDLYSGGTHTATTGLYTNGANPGEAPGGNSIALGLNLGSGDPMQVTLTYDGTNLIETVRDTVTGGTFSHVYTINLAQVMGASTAYVGFTGGTGGENATQDILNWSGSFQTSSGMGSAGDSSGNGNTGTISPNGVTRVASLQGLGGALQFDDSGTGYVTASDSASLDPQFNITVSAFINADRWDRGNERILQKGNNDNQYRLLEEGQVLKWDIAGVGTVTAPLSTVPTGQWHNVTGTYDGHTMILYVDGQVVGTPLSTSGNIPVTGDPLNVGTKTPTATGGDHFRGKIDEVRVYARALSQEEIRLLPLTDTDIGTQGNPVTAGSANINFSNGVVTVSGSGSDIWDTADHFNFAYEPIQGDGQITARVTNVQATDYWAKGAVMFRNTLDADSAFVDLVLTPTPSHSEASLQWRDTAGGGPGSVDQGPGSAPLPYWIRLTRQGNLFTAEKSTNGVNWVLVGTHTTIMNQVVYVGLAVTAHNNSGVLNTSTFDNVSIVSTQGQVVYRLDDGSSEENFNNSQGSETEDNWVANSFQVASGGQTLHAVQFQLGQDYTNHAITVAIYTGSSLTNPHAGTGLTRVNTTTTTFSGQSGNFVTIPLATPLTLPAGQVYWAAILLPGVPGNQFPFQTDRDSPQGRSWFDVGATQGAAYNLDITTRATVFGGTHPVVGAGVQSAGNLILRVIDDPTDPAVSADAGSSGASAVNATAVAAVVTTETANLSSLPGTFNVTTGAAPAGDGLSKPLGGPSALDGALLNALLGAPAGPVVNTSNGQPAASSNASPLLPTPAALADAGAIRIDAVAKELAGARLGSDQQDVDTDAVDAMFAQYPSDEPTA
jgi:hypothetical protein